MRKRELLVRLFANEMGDVIFAVENPSVARKDAKKNIPDRMTAASKFSFDYEAYIMNGGKKPNPKKYQ